MARVDVGGRSINLRLTCSSPPVSGAGDAATEFGLQDRQHAIHPGSLQEDSAVSYKFSLTVSRAGATNALRFVGPFVHGTPAVPFLYLSLRYRAAEPAAPIKRLKIPLASLTWDIIETAPEGALFTARVSGSGSGTVPLLDGGWILTTQPK